MTDDKLKTVEGEIVEKAESLGKEIEEEIREGARKGGVFIGTLNIMAAPARQFITDPLLDVYKDHYETKYKRPKHVFAFDTFLVLVGAALAAVSIYAFFIYKPFEPVKLTLGILPKHPSSGGEIIITAEIDNATDSPIDKAAVALRLPKDLTVKFSSVPFDRQSGTINFGTISGNTQAKARITARTTAPLGTVEKIIANLTYDDRKTGDTIKKNSFAELAIASSSLASSWELPEKIVAGSVFSGTIRYHNSGTTAFQNVVIAPNWPEGFALVSSQPASQKGLWTIGTVASGAEGTIVFRGRLDDAVDPAIFNADTGLKTSSDLAIQSQSTASVAVTDPKIGVKLDGTNIARLGDEINLTAICFNNGDQTLSNLKLNFETDDGLRLSSAVQLPSGELKPGAEIKIPVKIKIDQTLPQAIAKNSNPSLGFSATLSGSIPNDGAISLSSPKWNVKIAGGLGLNSVARYWSDQGDQLGRGPLPPEVGTTTRYWVFWTAANSTSAIDNAVVSAKLPPNVSFTGKASVPFGDAPYFDPATRELTWNAGNVPAFSGAVTTAISAAFELAIIPTPNQAGTYPTLLTNQKITGTDTGTGLSLSGKASDLSINLSDDPKAIGTGPVR